MDYLTINNPGHGRWFNDVFVPSGETHFFGIRVQSLSNNDEFKKAVANGDIGIIENDTTDEVVTAIKTAVAPMQSSEPEQEQTTKKRSVVKE